MKFECFNKIGDTTYRVKNQIKAYINFAQWYVDFYNAKEKEPSEDDFRGWVKKCQNPYNYDEKAHDKIKNRLCFVLENATSKYKLIKKNDKKYKFDLNWDDCYNDILNKLADATGNGDDSCNAFCAMLKFMVDNPKLNDAKKIALAFFIFEKGDDFKVLYHCTMADLVNCVFRKYTAEKIISHYFLMRKPARMKPICEKILQKSKGFFLLDEEFNYLKENHHIPTTIKSKNIFENFIKESSFDQIVRQFLKQRFTKLLYGDYFDLFNRVMFGLNLACKCGKNVSFYNNKDLHFDDVKKYFYVDYAPSKKIPYTYSEIDDYLKKIHNKDFSFITNDIHLCGVKACDVVEYFVNLKICVLFNLPINKIKECVNTILDNNFYPICHAPGRKSDMCLPVNDQTLLGIETTILNNDRSISMNESYPCFEHLAIYKPPHCENILLLVLPHGSDTTFIKKSFKGLADAWTEKTKRKFLAKVLTFNDLLNIHNPKQLL